MGRIVRGVVRKIVRSPLGRLVGGVVKTGLGLVKKVAKFALPVVGLAAPFLLPGVGGALTGLLGKFGGASGLFGGLATKAGALFGKMGLTGAGGLGARLGSVFGKVFGKGTAINRLFGSGMNMVRGWGRSLSSSMQGFQAGPNNGMGWMTAMMMAPMAFQMLPMLGSMFGMGGNPMQQYPGMMMY